MSLAYETPPDEKVILLVEDRADDIALVHRAFTCAQVKNPLFVVRDGEQAIEYLEGIGKYQSRAEFPLPDLMLVDLRMPMIDGFELLHWMRSQPGLKTLPVIVLTSSIDVSEVDRAYEAGANSFLVKPLELENFAVVGRALAGLLSDGVTGAGVESSTCSHAAR